MFFRKSNVIFTLLLTNAKSIYYLCRMNMLILTWWFQIIEWIEQHQSPCLIRSITGHECPGCGLQSAMIALLRGNISDSIYKHPGLIPMLVCILFLIFHLIFKIKNGHNIIIFLIFFVLIVFISNFIWKLASHN